MYLIITLSNHHIITLVSSFEIVEIMTFGSAGSQPGYLQDSFSRLAH